jgi:uncharacterized protein (TIGR02271 family)
MQTSTKTVVGVFDDFATAQRAAERLVENGFTRDQIEVTSGQNYANESARGNTGLTGGAPSDRSGGGISGFFHRLFGSDDDDERGHYSEAIRRGAAVVAVTTDDRDDQAADILEEYGAIDIDHLAASWRQRGYKRYDPSAPPFNEQEAAREREYYKSDRGERTVPVVQEELRVGKRAVRKGGVRIFNRVREQPVEEQVELREERVHVDRRPANRPATDADVRARDEVIEVTEMAEEPVVDKRTRVVEEVVVGKETRTRTEKVRDTVRKSDVQVEKLGKEATGRRDYDDDFERDFRSRYGSDRSARYEDYAPAYQYGYRMASDERYRGRNWDDVESTLKTDYERNNPNSKWDQVKGSVRYGWEKLTGKR